jgi:dihydropteroate synthase
MGIVNITPDSFSDGGVFLDAEAACAHARRLLAEGADVLDLGAESTRPGATPVSLDEELSRLLPVVQRLVSEGIRCLSIDTYKAAVAAAALAEGASWINDVSGLADPGLAVAATAGDALIVMHQRPMSPANVEDDVAYTDVVDDVRTRLAALVQTAVGAGVTPDRVLVDPGIGFGKSVRDNLTLLAAGDALAAVGRPVLIGPSRKRFVTALSGAIDVQERDIATIGACCAAALGGAHMVRVHDVRSTRLALDVIDAVRRQQRRPDATE